MPSPRVERCPTCDSRTDLAKRRDRRGNWQLIDWCIYCARRVGTHFIPRHLVDDNDFWGLYHAPDAAPADPEQCPICEAEALLEEHHLGPRELFGDASDRWAKQDICRPCHERWHAVMGHPIGGCAAPVETLRRLARMLEQHGYTVTVRASGAA